jgi:hypothetical protein
VTLLLAVFTIGIGLGSLLCERLSAGHVEIGLVPFGSIGLTLFGIDLAFASPALLPAGAPLPLTACSPCRGPGACSSICSRSACSAASSSCRCMR